MVAEGAAARSRRAKGFRAGGRRYSAERRRYASSGGGTTPGGEPTPPAGGSNGSALSKVVYVADQAVFEKYELWVADPASSAPPVRLNGTLSANGDVDAYKFTPSAGTVVYTADETTLNRSELYIVNVNNPGLSTRLNTPLTLNRDVVDFAVSPDGSKVAYRADQDSDNVYELYLVNVASPGVSVKLNPSLVSGGWIRSGFEFSPDGTKVLYRADQEVVDRLELYTVDVASPGSSHKVNSALVSGGNVYSAFSFSPDNKTIAYVADQDTDEQLELYIAAAATLGTTQKMNGVLIPDGDVCRYEWSPDSKRIAYCADQETDGVLELYTVALDQAGQSVKMNPPLVSGGAVTSGYSFSDDSSFLVYAAKQDAPARTDIYRVNIATPGVTTKVNASLVSGGNVVGFRISNDGARVAYVANQENADVYEVYQADFLTPGTATKLSGKMSATGAYRVRYSADGLHAVYMADQDSDAAELYHVDLAVPGQSSKLNGTLAAGGEVWGLRAGRVRSRLSARARRGPLEPPRRSRASYFRNALAYASGLNPISNPAPVSSTGRLIIDGCSRINAMALRASRFFFFSSGSLRKVVPARFSTVSHPAWSTQRFEVGRVDARDLVVVEGMRDVMILQPGEGLLHGVAALDSVNGGSHGGGILSRLAITGLPIRSGPQWTVTPSF